MQAIRSTRPGGHVGYVGVSHDVATARRGAVLLPRPPARRPRPGAPVPARADRPDLEPAASTPARSSTSSCRWTRPPRATRPWTSAARSRSCSGPDLRLPAAAATPSRPEIDGNGPARRRACPTRRTSWRSPMRRGNRSSAARDRPLTLGVRRPPGCAAGTESTDPSRGRPSRPASAPPSAHLGRRRRHPAGGPASRHRQARAPAGRPRPPRPPDGRVRPGRCAGSPFTGYDVEKSRPAALAVCCLDGRRCTDSVDIVRQE